MRVQGRTRTMRSDGPSTIENTDVFVLRGSREEKWNEWAGRDKERSSLDEKSADSGQPKKTAKGGPVLLYVTRQRPVPKKGARKPGLERDKGGL